MSGNRWGRGLDEEVRALVATVGHDPAVTKRWPTTHRALVNLAEALYKVIHELDWILSGDWEEDDPSDTFDKITTHYLLSALINASPQEWFNANLDQLLSPRPSSTPRLKFEPPTTRPESLSTLVGYCTNCDHYIRDHRSNRIGYASRSDIPPDLKCHQPGCASLTPEIIEVNRYMVHQIVGYGLIRRINPEGHWPA